MKKTPHLFVVVGIGSTSSYPLQQQRNNLHLPFLLVFLLSVCDRWRPSQYCFSKKDAEAARAFSFFMNYELT